MPLIKLEKPGLKMAQYRWGRAPGWVGWGGGGGGGAGWLRAVRYQLAFGRQVAAQQHSQHAASLEACWLGGAPALAMHPAKRCFPAGRCCGTSGSGPQKTP